VKDSQHWKKGDHFTTHPSNIFVITRDEYIENNKVMCEFREFENDICYAIEIIYLENQHKLSDEELLRLMLEQ